MWRKRGGKANMWGVSRENLGRAEITSRGGVEGRENLEGREKVPAEHLVEYAVSC